MGTRSRSDGQDWSESSGESDESGSALSRGARAVVELPVTADLCSKCISLTAVDGAAVTVLSSSSARELMYATDALAQHLDELQFTSGDGPCVDAFLSGSPVLCNDTSDSVHAASWPGFSSDAERSGVGGVYAFPLRGGRRVFGVLELYRRVPGALTQFQLDAAVASADAIASSLLDELSLDEDSHTGGMANAFHRPEVNQAVGMIAVQLKVPVTEALSRLRATAYSSDKPIWEVAGDVVHRRLRFSDGGGESD
ncbi:GAF and ANTAR domain-containing protein [Rhodococcus sp. NPDC056743]|uniref:GAF and ANTAR domain-containing protein n=1 Tax=Rhodococcus sp. NPDC056743 TaxID=3345934 RepID=UPI0036709364